MYDFHPLAVESIRLIKIEPELSHGHLVCTLSQYDGQVPPYDALSYYWGDPTPTRKIYVNDSPVDVHEALWEFMDHMQRSQQTGNWIWTDFLCLDQRNNEEMGQQVPRMGHIYSRAVRTISWLGCSRSPWIHRLAGLSTPSPDLEGDLRQIGSKVLSKRESVESFFAQPELLRWTKLTERLLGRSRLRISIPSERNTTNSGVLPKAIPAVIQLGQGHMISPILNILSLPYWTRVWVAQEVALAKELTLMFENSSLDFKDFLLAYKSHYYYTLQTMIGLSVVRVPIEARAAVYENDVSFYQIVRWGLDCEASKPIDRIYGLLGLLAHFGDGTHTLPSTLTGTIDYTRNLCELFWDIAFTRLFPSDTSAADEKNQMEGIERWVESLPALGQVLTCPFTYENLRSVLNERVTPLFRDKARLTLSLVDICRYVSMPNAGFYVETKDPCDIWPPHIRASWPTKRHARRLLFDPGEILTNRTTELQRLLGCLLLETTNESDMDENDLYQAICIGLEMSKMGRSGAPWNCGFHQGNLDSVWTAPEHEVGVSFRCLVRWEGEPPSQAPCSSVTWPPEDPHRCRTQDRYLAIPGTAWRLSLQDLPSNSKALKYWQWYGTLNVKY